MRAGPFQLHRSAREQGFSIVETLVAITLLSIGGLGIAHSVINSHMLSKRSIRHMYAHTIAQSKLEELQATDPIFLDNADDESNVTVIFGGVSFLRSVNITVNTDASRSIVVTVQGTNAELGGSAELATVVSLWGNV